MLLIIVALAIGFVVGLLVGRKNPKIANTLAADAAKLRRK